MPSSSFDAPIVCPEQKVQPAWIDYNEHMNMAYYSLVFDLSLDYVYEQLGLGPDYKQSSRCTTFSLEAHVMYLREVGLGDPLRITYQLLDCDAKRLHFMAQMFHAEQGYLAATSEQISMHISLETRRSAPFPADLQARIEALLAAHASLPRPPQVGHVIGIPRK
jgi:acyl-CoA thioester hydrolase